MSIPPHRGGSLWRRWAAVVALAVMAMATAAEISEARPRNRHGRAGHDLAVAAIVDERYSSLVVPTVERRRGLKRWGGQARRWTHSRRATRLSSPKSRATASAKPLRPPAHTRVAGSDDPFDRAWDRIAAEYHATRRARPAPITPGDRAGILARADVLDYLRRTARPGGTMTRQGPELALERLHPRFAARLAAAIREARDVGIPAGVFSAYRPPAFGIGGFGDKAASLHAYGLAVDVYGIGGPGSTTARRWHRIAAAHNVHGVYGPGHRAEFNHFQAISLRMIARSSPLRRTITARGPVNIERMWRMADTLIEASAQRRR